MTWFNILSRRKVIENVFATLQGDGTKDDRMHRFLRRLTIDNTGSVDDLFHKQMPITREMLIAVIEARVQRRLC